MTNKETAEIIKTAIAEIEWEYPMEYAAAFDKAIEVLEQEPCEDVISRQAVSEAVRKIGLCKCNTNEIEAVDECLRTVEDLPSVQLEQKTGYWVEYTRVLIPEPINKWEQAWYCSECGYGNQECEDGSAWLEWKYCPNCGSKMAESEG